MSRLLVIDEDLSKRIATELRRRGRNAKRVTNLGLKGTKDPSLLQHLHDLDPNCVLITGDNDMPASHGADLRRLGTTVAIVQPWNPSHQLAEPEWEHEIVEKWAHRIEEQAPGSIIRYSLKGGRKWTPRKRPVPTGEVALPASRRGRRAPKGDRDSLRVTVTP